MEEGWLHLSCERLCKLAVVVFIKKLHCWTRSIWNLILETTGGGGGRSYSSLVIAHSRTLLDLHVPEDKLGLFLMVFSIENKDCNYQIIIGYSVWLMQILGDGLGGENGKLPQTGVKRRWRRYWIMGKGLSSCDLIFFLLLWTLFCFNIALFLVLWVDLDGSTALPCSSWL